MGGALVGFFLSFGYRELGGYVVVIVLIAFGFRRFDSYDLYFGYGVFLGGVFY